MNAYPEGKRRRYPRNTHLGRYQWDDEKKIEIPESGGRRQFFRPDPSVPIQQRPDRSNPGWMTPPKDFHRT